MQPGSSINLSIKIGINSEKDFFHSDLEGYAHRDAAIIFDKFIANAGEIEIGGTAINVIPMVDSDQWSVVKNPSVHSTNPLYFILRFSLMKVLVKKQYFDCISRNNVVYCRIFYRIIKI